MPRTVIERVLPRPVPRTYSLWDRKDWQRLRRALNVSQAAIAIRLEQLGIIAGVGPQSFWRKPRPPRPKKRPVWQRYRRYLGRRATRLGREAVERDAITTTELSRILDIKVRDVEAMLG